MRQHRLRIGLFYSRGQRAKQPCLHGYLATTARVKYLVACSGVFDCFDSSEYTSNKCSCQYLFERLFDFSISICPYILYDNTFSVPLTGLRIFSSSFHKYISSTGLSELSFPSIPCLSCCDLRLLFLNGEIKYVPTKSHPRGSRQADVYIRLARCPRK